jgi:hypothetical protein
MSTKTNPNSHVHKLKPERSRIQLKTFINPWNLNVKHTNQNQKQQQFTTNTKTNEQYNHHQQNQSEWNGSDSSAADASVAGNSSPSSATLSRDQWSRQFALNRSKWVEREKNANKQQQQTIERLTKIIKVNEQTNINFKSRKQ